MKRDTLERWVLLKQSGELSRWKEWLLTRRLARDPALQAFAQDAGDIGLLSRSHTPGELPAHVADAIHARLSEPVDRRSIITLEPEPGKIWRPAFAWAACLAVLAAGALYMRLGDDQATPSRTLATAEADRLAWNDSLDATLDEMDAWLAGGSAEVAANQPSSNGNGEEEQLIRELLALEGITI